MSRDQGRVVSGASARVNDVLLSLASVRVVVLGASPFPLNFSIFLSSCSLPGVDEELYTWKREMGMGNLRAGC